MASDSVARTTARAVLLSSLVLASAFWPSASRADAPPSNDYCFTPTNGTQTCYPTLGDAEAAMRASTPIGRFLYKYDESTNSTGSWTYRYYRADKQEPEWHGIPGYRVGGWTPSDLGCTPSAYPGPGPEWCHDEGEAAALWTARRARTLGGSCHYYGGSLAGGLSVPTSLTGAYSGSRNGAANYPDHATPGGRHIAESWWCEGWGTPDIAYHKTGVAKAVPFRCPEGFRTVNPASDWPRVCLASTTYRILVRTSQLEGCAANANPCYPATGEKRRYEPDFEFAGEPFVRTYRSRGEFALGHLGVRWHHSYGSRIGSANGSTRFFVSEDGSFLEIDNAGTVDGVPHYRIRGLSDHPARAIGGNYEVIDSAGHTSVYHGTLGTLLRRRHASNPLFDLEFVYVNGELKEVVDGSGRKLTFHYSDSNVLLDEGGLIPAMQYTRLLTEIVLPDGGVVEYRYDTYGNLVEVTRPDGSRRTYHYDEPAFDPGATRGLMTGISDDGTRHATFTYDTYGRVKSSTLAGGNERTELAYVSATQVDVTTANGDVRRYTFGTDLQRRLLSVQTARGLHQNRYDTSGRRIESVSPAGILTKYGYSNGLLSSVTEAAGTVDERVTTLTRDSLGRVASAVLSNRDGTLLVARSKGSLVRDAAGRVAAQCLYDVAGANAGYACGSAPDAPVGVRQTTFTYCTDAEAATTDSTCPVVGLRKAVDGPRVGDTISFEYRPSDDLSGCGTTTGNCHRKGDLYKIIDSLGNATLIQRYDLAGRPTEVSDQNSVHTRFEYDTRGRLAARKVLGPTSGSEADDAITRIEYGAAGQASKVTSPDGSFMKFTYDDAQRLVGIEDALGNTITYQLDRAGNRFQEEIKDPDGLVRHTLARVFNTLGELETAADAYANPTDFTYDEMGQVDTVTDAHGRVTDNAYDALGRLRESIANVTGSGGERAQSQFDYDALDRLTAVIDPKGLTTSYRYDGLGNLEALTSPDTGTTTYTYDAAGNVATVLDARGVQSIFGYDDLGRLASIDRPSAGQDITFSFDDVPYECQAEETFGIGRLGTMTDASGSTQYCYDRRGNIARKVQAVTGATASRTLAYDHDLADRVQKIVYPSGATVTYTRDANGQITGIDAKPTATAASVTLVSDVDYLPFGPARTITFGNGRVLDKSRDLNYGIDAVADNAPGGLSIDYGLDDVGNVTALDERLANGTTAARTVTYDGLDRLTALKNGTTNVQSFTYDVTGNRTKKNSQVYAYETNSHRLTATGTTLRDYDDAGNTIANGTKSFTYDDAGRMASYLSNGTLSRTFAYNGAGQRVAKKVPGSPGSDTYFVYDEAGHLMGEYRGSGTRVREYVWMDDTPVAVFVSHAGTTYQYILTDHLDSPRAVVLPTTNAIVWRWDLTGSAFGEHAVQQNPDGDATNYVLPLRYPGQYHDTETATYYNYFRDYEPTTGRYLQSDPVGLRAGLSTFGYVSQAPFNRIDPFGLTDWVGTSLEYSVFGFGGATYTLSNKCTGRGENRYLVRVQVTNVGADTFALGKILSRFLKFGVVYVGSNVSFSDNRTTPDPYVFEGPAADYSIGIAPGVGGGVGNTRLGDASSGVGASALFGVKIAVGASVGDATVTSVIPFGKCKKNSGDCDAVQ